MCLRKSIRVRFIYYQKSFLYQKAIIIITNIKFNFVYNYQEVDLYALKIGEVF